MVWDPHLKKDRLLLDSVQLFAMRMATHSWKEAPQALSSQCQLPPLSSRRSFFKLLYTFMVFYIVLPVSLTCVVILTLEYLTVNN